MKWLTVLKRWGWLVLAGIGAAVLFVLRGRTRERAEELGEAKGHAEAELERLKDAARSGDERRVEEEWRRHRK